MQARESDLHICDQFRIQNKFPVPKVYATVTGRREPWYWNEQFAN
jgi:hypothetical protein